MTLASGFFAGFAPVPVADFAIHHHLAMMAENAKIDQKKQPL